MPEHEIRECNLEEANDLLKEGLWECFEVICSPDVGNPNGLVYIMIKEF
jgi:hypothetical protein